MDPSAPADLALAPAGPAGMLLILLRLLQGVSSQRRPSFRVLSGMLLAILGIYLFLGAFGLRFGTMMTAT